MSLPILHLQVSNPRALASLVGACFAQDEPNWSSLFRCH